MKHIKQFNFFDISEGVGDRYAEKEFGIPDLNREKNIIASSRVEDVKGELVGYIKNYRYYDYSNHNISEPIKVYMNPKNLEKFDYGVKAISNYDGDLFVAQGDLSFDHMQISNAVNKEGKYRIGSAYDYHKNITWYRIYNTDKFRYGGTFTSHMANINQLRLRKALELLRIKNPNFEFIESSNFKR
jgi:hypothetical protein